MRKRVPATLVSNYGRIQSGFGKRKFPRKATSGYCVHSFRCKRVIMAHKLVHILFNDPELVDWSEGKTVDHINQCKTDNRQDNLRWATRSEQRLNQTRPDVDHTAYHASPIELVEIATGTRTRFPTLTLAAAFLDVTLPAMYKAQVRGYRVVRLEDADLPGEVWKKYGTAKVSNLGRIQRAGISSRKYFPKCNHSGYARIKAKGKTTMFSNAVLEVFGIPRPSLQHTADHIDQTPSNNALGNLRWATAKEQRQNQSPRDRDNTQSQKAVRCRLFGSSVWTNFPSSSVAATTLGVCANDIRHAANPKHGSKCAKTVDGSMFECQYCEKSDELDGEMWKPIVDMDWAPGGKYASV